VALFFETLLLTNADTFAMKNITALSFLILMISFRAQSQKVHYSIGPEFSLPTFSGIPSYGTGAGFSLGYYFNKRIEGDIGISYNYFKGNVSDVFKHDTIRSFSIMPILFRGKYFFGDKFYVSGAVGLVIGLHHAANHFALSPGTGVLIPVSAKSKIDLGVLLIGVPAGYSFSENNFLNKGGYSFITFRIAYVF
jgi:hypothetical protein